MAKSWYSIQNKTDARTARISIHDEIGLWGISAKQFIDELQAAGDIKSLELSINSPGGNVIDGLAIYNVLKAHPASVYGKVQGIAASTASFILMAADHIEMPEDSFLMIHNTHGGAVGNSEDLRETADLMDKLSKQISNIYQKRTGKTDAQIKALMDKETWMNADEAYENGFIDLVTNKIDVAAKASNFGHYFKEMPFESELPQIQNVKDFERYLRDTGLSRSKAAEMVAKVKTALQRDAEDGNNQPLIDLANRLDRLKIPTSLRD